MPIDRPPEGGAIALGDDDLAKIGLAVVFESGAKAVASSALRALCSIDEKQWIKLERTQFSQILEKIADRIKDIADIELSQRFVALESAVKQSQEARHIIVHTMWGAGGTGFLGYDYGRKREVNEHDIEKAVQGCAEINRAAHWFAMRVANLIEDRVLLERPEGVGMTIRTSKGLVRL